MLFGMNPFLVLLCHQRIAVAKRQGMVAGTTVVVDRQLWKRAVD